MRSPSTTPRKQPRQARAQATRASIVKAAAQLFAAAGYADTTTNAIAARAGVSIGSLYEYFPNKDAIVSTLTAELLDEQFEVFAAALRGAPPDTPLDALARGAIDALIATKRIRPRLFHALATGAPPALRGRLLRAWNGRARAAVVELLARRPELVPADRDLDLLVFVMVNAAYGVIDAVLVERPTLISDERLVDELVGLVTAYAARG